MPALTGFIFFIFIQCVVVVRGVSHRWCRDSTRRKIVKNVTLMHYLPESRVVMPKRRSPSTLVLTCLKEICSSIDWFASHHRQQFVCLSKHSFFINCFASFFYDLFFFVCVFY